MQEDALAELQKRIGVSVSISNSNTKKIVDELEDTELLELASKLVGERALSNKEVVIALLSVCYAICARMLCLDFLI